MDDKVNITFDDEFRLRVLDADKYKQTESLDAECTAFVNKIQEFNTTVHSLVEVLDKQSKKIETEKLKAIGQRNRVDSESEARGRAQAALKNQINEKMTELERYNKQHESLSKVEQEQKLLIERLSNNES